MKLRVDNSGPLQQLKDRELLAMTWIGLFKMNTGRLRCQTSGVSLCQGGSAPIYIVCSRIAIDRVGKVWDRIKVGWSYYMQ